VLTEEQREYGVGGGLHQEDPGFGEGCASEQAKCKQHSEDDETFRCMLFSFPFPLTQTHLYLISLVLFGCYEFTLLLGERGGYSVSCGEVTPKNFHSFY
jgi:hypothetical protein